MTIIVCLIVRTEVHFDLETLSINSSINMKNIMRIGAWAVDIEQKQLDKCEK